jgi:hypothetical protein
MFSGGEEFWGDRLVVKDITEFATCRMRYKQLSSIPLNKHKATFMDFYSYWTAACINASEEEVARYYERQTRKGPKAQRQRKQAAQPQPAGPGGGGGGRGRGKGKGKRR